MRPALAAIGLALLSIGSSGQTPSLRVLVSNGLKGAMEELQSQCEKSAGGPLAIQFNSTASVKKKIEAGEAFDVTMITREAIDDLIKQGKIANGSKVNLGRSELGIGIRAGAAKPDIRTVAALKRAFLEAKSITFPKDGASRGFIEQMFEKMGIAAELQPKIILADGSGPATESVAEGKAAMVITLFSEIVPVRGTAILGPLPGEFQSGIKFAAAISASTKSADAAKAFVGCVTGPKAAPVFKAKGLEIK
jgi:molybdate transport system substrate-binding protein